VAVLLLVYFVSSASGDLGFYDSAELAMVAAQGGLGHPIGQPLHTALGALLAALPGVGPRAALWLITWLSCVPAALCAVPALALARQAGARPGWAGFVVALGALHLVTWESATRVEVYALATFFALWAVAKLGEASVAPTMSPRAWGAAGLALGLSAGANAHVALISGALAGAAALWQARRAPGMVRCAPVTILGGLLGLTVFAYLPWAAARSPEVFAWSRDDLPRFLLGLDYAQNRQFLAEPWLEKLTRNLAWSLEAQVIGPLVLAALGAAAAPRLAWLGLGGWALTSLLVMSNSTYLPTNTDYYGYLAAPWFAVIAGAASLASRVAEARRGVGIAAALVVGVATILAEPGPLSRTRHVDHAARTLAIEVLETAPPDALVFVGSDHFVWPILALQTVEGVRPDVVVLADGLLDSSWFWAWTFARHPALTQTPLAGPREVRLRRFVDAQGERPVLFERGAMSGWLGRPVCADRLFARAAPCPADVELGAGSSLIAGLVDAVGQGSPPADEVLAQVAVDRGDLLWTLGQPRAALDAYLSGVPAAERAGLDLEGWAAPAPLRHPEPRWRQQHPLGRPERALFRAAELAHAARLHAAAETLLARAAARGLSEAAYTPPPEPEDK